MVTLDESKDMMLPLQITTIFIINAVDITRQNIGDMFRIQVNIKISVIS